ncbi:hypothetical protein [Bradyrhizobium sp. Ghvi]|uniref:hypothetical protein n=1 Tax=Bradyrhizobium sp. Ghvi TaxID=1855319 RepID=UPI0015A66DF7|nr:hypothetical protein [Bradyrhizobium sp. Ghvi]
MSEADRRREHDCRQTKDFPRRAHRSLFARIVAAASITRRTLSQIDVDQARHDVRAELLLSSNVAK